MQFLEKWSWTCKLLKQKYKKLLKTKYFANFAGGCFCRQEVHITVNYGKCIFILKVIFYFCAYIFLNIGNGLKFKELVLSGDFELATKEIKSFDNEFLDELIPFLYENPNISFYGFISYLTHNSFTQNANLHYLASELLITCFSHFLGAYNLAFYHAKKASDMEPKILKYKENLLLFYNIPEKLLKKEIAVELAKDILKFDNNHIIAKKILLGVEKYL